MLRKFRVKLNEKEYIVEMEEVGNPSGTTFEVPQASPVAQTQVSNTNSENVEGGTTIEAPMPGNILDIKVNLGDKVETNQVLLVLEAMKMENNIVAPHAGVVVAISAVKGSTIDVGETMIVIKA
jgi:Acetyl/propionyl-CoA carboxylase, alpha subunit